MAYRDYSVANGFLVDPLGNGDFTTITNALAAATSGTDIFIRPGTYTENFSTKAGVNLIGFPGDSLILSVTILGTVTANFSGSASIANINLQTNSANSLVVSGSSATNLFVSNCNFNCTNATGLSYTSSSASSGINILNCTGNLATTGIGIYSSSSIGIINISGSIFTNTGASVTASTASAGAVVWTSSQINSPVSYTGTSIGSFLTSVISTINQNTISLIFNSSTQVAVRECNFFSGTATAITVGAANSLFIADCIISSTNVNTISGPGSITYTGFFYSGSAFTYNNAVTTVTRNIFDGGFYLGTNTNSTLSSGVLGEQIRSAIPVGSAVALSTGVPANVTSLSLTPGIWDVTGIVNLNGTLTGTSFIAGVASTSASFTGVSQGDNGTSTSTLSTALSDQTLTIPVWRVALTATTTIYLLAQSTFSVGTAAAYGRISGTRVA